MAKKKKKKTSKKKISNLFEGEVIKTADYNKAHGLVEEPALRSAAEILAPIKEHRLNEPDMTRCSKCGHKCHCDSKKPFVYRTWIGEVGTNPPETKEHKCNKCHHAEVVKDFPKKKKKRVAKASLIDLLDRKRFGKGAVKNETV
jgi:hypothetical protein|tara:strand:+ start:255 stop:686 length:432 start_codon:yes stop_codon:yes gene_type:complete